MDNVLAYNGSVNISGSSEKIEYPYTINTITITNENGGVYKSAPTDSGFIVDVDITKNEERDSKDYFIVAVYSKDGSLLSLNYMKANISTNESFSCGVYIPRINGEIGEIKAFVWSSISDMMPLAESVSLK
jgi:hypothetical protein